MSNAVYVEVKTTKNFKITAIEKVYKVHKGTNMLVETDDKVLLNEELFKGATQQLAEFEAMKKIDKMDNVDMDNVEIITRPFPG